MMNFFKRENREKFYATLNALYMLGSVNRLKDHPKDGIEGSKNKKVKKATGSKPFREKDGTTL